MLNPETSSDSPSAKSKGVRLVSATALTSQRTPSGGTTRTLTGATTLVIAAPLKELLKIRTTATITANLTSYERVWATPRNAPIVAYFLFEDHPDISKG